MHLRFQSPESVFSRWLYKECATYALKGACAGKRAGAHTQRPSVCCSQCTNMSELYFVYQDTPFTHGKNNNNAESTPERVGMACARRCGYRNTLPTVLETVDLDLYGPYHSESIIFAKQSCIIPGPVSDFQCCIVNCAQLHTSSPGSRLASAHNSYPNLAYFT